MASGNDWVYMQRCIQLARLGAGNVAPNPMVGAVLVHENKIIGEGYHQQYGQAHAEVNCIRNAEEYADRISLLASSTLYVSLEPCAHFGKTPPCADLVISKRIPKVVIGCRDPFKQVDGKGIEKLENAGIEVVTGVMEEECKSLNERFFTFHIKRRPFIILKWAQTANGRIAGPDSSRILISNEVTNRLVHRWRSEEASILVGTTTALKDDPSLTTRLWSGKNPLRLIIDRNLQLPDSLRLFNGEAKTIIFNSVRQGENDNCRYYQLNNEQSFTQQITNALFQLNIQSVLVEGGSKLLQSFIDEDLWDEARVITNNDLQIAEGTRAPDMPETNLADTWNIYSDTIRTFKPSTLKAVRYSI